MKLTRQEYDQKISLLLDTHKQYNVFCNKRFIDQDEVYKLQGCLRYLHINRKITDKQERMIEAIIKHYEPQLMEVKLQILITRQKNEDNE